MKRIPPTAVFGCEERRVDRAGAVTGMPRLIAPWFMPMLEGYASTVLEMSGARSPRIRFSAPERDGEREAIETVAVRFEVSWS